LLGARQDVSPSNHPRAKDRLALFLAAVAVCLAFFFSFIEIVDYDVWMHLASGRLIASQRHIPAHYPFAFTTDATWYYHEWLSAVVFYAIERVGGMAGLALLRVALALATLYVLYRIVARTLPAWERFAVLFLAMLLLKERWMDRPYLVTTFLFAVYLYHLLPPDHLSLRKIAILIGLMIVWANAHAGFVFGIMLIGIFFLEEAMRWSVKAIYADERESVIPDLSERMRRLSIFLAFAFLATLLNPYFVNVYRVPALLATYKLYHANIYEWFPPTVTIRYAHYWLMLALTIAVCLMTVRRIRLSLGLLVALTSYLSVRYVRFSDLAAIVFAAALAQQLPYLRASSEQIDAEVRSFRVRRQLYLAARAILTCAVACLVMLHVWTFPYKHSLRVRERILPEKAVEFIHQAHLPQNLFNMYHWGGYVEWALFPEYRVFIDGRNEVFGEALFEEYGNALIGAPGWEATLTKHGVQTALLTYTQVHPFARTETRLHELLYESSRWALVYWDDVALVFVRRSEASREIIERYEERDVNPTRHDWIGKIAGDAAQRERVVSALGRKIQMAPDCSLARILLAQVFMEQHRKGEAQEQLTLALEANPRSAAALSFLTILAIEDGKAREAFRYLRMRQKIGSLDKFYYNHKGAAYLLVGKYRAALRCFNKALALDPAFTEAQKNKIRTLVLIERRR
jgi:tetratricopeptide (TPR) repeat protein